MTAGQWWLPPEGPSVDPRTPGYQIDAHAFNAVTRVLGEAAEFVALSVRQRIARAVVAEVVPLAISEERERCAAEVRAKADELDGNVDPHPELSRSFTAGMRRAAGYIVHGEYPPAVNPDASPDAATWMAPDE